MDTAITINGLLVGAGCIVALWGLVKVIREIIEYFNQKHDDKQKLDSHDAQIEELHSEMDAKLQEIKAEQCMLTYCMMATLDGLHQLGCNGKVTQARSELDKFMNKQAHEV